MKQLLKISDWDLVPRIVQVKTIGDALHFIALRSRDGKGTPSLRCDAEKEPMATAALLNDFALYTDDTANCFRPADVSMLRANAATLELKHMQASGTPDFFIGARAMRNLASRIQLFVRPLVLILCVLLSSCRLLDTTRPFVGCTLTNTQTFGTSGYTASTSQHLGDCPAPKYDSTYTVIRSGVTTVFTVTWDHR